MNVANAASGEAVTVGGLPLTDYLAALAGEAAAGGFRAGLATGILIGTALFVDSAGPMDAAGLDLAVTKAQQLAAQLLRGKTD
ncbi:MAG: hypothetical protein ABSA21_07090 [Candidatus Limnocylindrales bacterium]|jgi:hypothetical protein